MSDETRASRFDRWIRRSWPFVLLFLVAAALPTAYAVTQLVSIGRDYYRDTYLWRDDEYDKIASLHGGISIAKVEEILGSPLFVRASEDGSLTESTFEGRDYWVQAVHDQQGTTQLIAVTSCAADFRPRIETPFGRVVLNESVFDSLTIEPYELRYFLSGATANSFFFDAYAGGNPGLYKTYFLGINDACPAVRNYAIEGQIDVFEYGYYDGVDFASGESTFEDFRANSVINTYAETYLAASTRPDVGIFIEPSRILESFQIGVDRLLTRTVHPDQLAGPVSFSDDDVSEYIKCYRDVHDEYIERRESHGADRPTAPRSPDFGASADETSVYERALEEYRREVNNWELDNVQIDARLAEASRSCTEVLSQGSQ